MPVFCLLVVSQCLDNFNSRRINDKERKYLCGIIFKVSGREALTFTFYDYQALIMLQSAKA
jgi:hypothetical protein